MARDYLEREVRTSRDYRCASMGRQDSARCVRWSLVKDDVFHTHRPETSIGDGAFGYDFGALESTDNRFTKSFTDLGYGSPPFQSQELL